jgi:DNA modification methylase
MAQHRIFSGHCLHVLRSLRDESFHSVVTDPPYELGFMGKDWDNAKIAFNPRVWQHCYRVLKPGGYLLAFGGTRTFHRLAVAIEDAGFEIRDSIAWIYGTGFPKSADVSKAIDKSADAEREVVGSKKTRIPGGTTYAQDEWTLAAREMSDVDITAPATDAAKKWQGWGTALKPGWESIICAVKPSEGNRLEPIIVARKPLIGTVAANVIAHGTGALNIDACRVGGDDGDRRRNASGGGLGGTETFQIRERHIEDIPRTSGRWPANVVLDEETAAELDRQSGVSAGGQRREGIARPRPRQGGVEIGEGNKNFGVANAPDNYGDSGGASRFFYCAKAPAKERPKVDGVSHPTVKPLELMRWLVKLVTPPRGRILDPFAGSGTTVEAAILEGFRPTAIELNDGTNGKPDYVAMIEKRAARAYRKVADGSAEK